MGQATLLPGLEEVGIPNQSLIHKSMLWYDHTDCLAADARTHTYTLTHTHTPHSHRHRHTPCIPSLSRQIGAGQPGADSPQEPAVQPVLSSGAQP